MLKSVEITNFKNLQHLYIDLEPLTIFVGANAGGKTSILEAIHCAERAASIMAENPGRQGSVFEGERHCDWLYTRGASGDLSITCAGNDGSFKVSATPPPGFPPVQTELLGSQQWSIAVIPADQNALKRALVPTRRLAFLHLNASKMAEPSYTAQIPPRLNSDGEYLASLLAFTALNDPDGFAGLVEEMRCIIPELKRIRFTKSTVHLLEREFVKFGNDTVERNAKREFQGDAILFDFNNADNVSAQNLSEGTLMLLGLVAVLMGPAKPDILLLDDIEHGLHPLAQKKLLELLSKIMARHPRLQILATAHSPYLLDGLQPEQVRLITLGDDGHAVCGRLTDHPQFDKWKDEMAPGELWSLFGEKWVAEKAVSGG